MQTDKQVYTISVEISSMAGLVCFEYILAISSAIGCTVVTASLWMSGYYLWCGEQCKTNNMWYREKTGTIIMKIGTRVRLVVEVVGW